MAVYEIFREDQTRKQIMETTHYLRHYFYVLSWSWRCKTLTK